MTQEQKAKAYDEALERAKEYNFDGAKQVVKDFVTYIFPELKESKDEKIRKILIDYMRSVIDINGIKGEEIIAWLEKQESVEEIVERCKISWYNEGKIQGQIEGLSDDEKYQQGWHDAIEKQREQKPIEKPTKGNYYTCIKNYQFCEHDDVTFEMGKIYKCEEDGKITADNGGLWSFSNIIGFFRLSTHEEILNHLQKPAWSEEDDEMLDSIIGEVRYIGDFPDYPTKEEDELYDKCLAKVEWLKTLKQRCTWKPSEEQMKALRDLNLTGNISYAGQGQTLIELYNDLKKLKGE